MSYSAQVSLFGKRELDIEDLMFQPPPSEDPDGLRWYQREAFDRNLQLWNAGSNSLLVVLATGLGKTVLFSAHAKREQGRVLVLAHRDELVTQAAATLQRMVSGRIGIEKADQKSTKERVVVGSIQSVSTDSRLSRLGKKDFDLIIIDEGHHAVSPSYQKVLNHFDCKKLLVTATPDRADEKALGKVVDEVSYEMDILAGINAGYLVPIDGQSLRVTELDLSAVDKSGGDLVQAALDNAVVRAVEGIVHQTLEHHPNKHAICFFPGVKSAEYAAERFNAAQPGSTCVISGKTEDNLRKSLTQQFRDGRIKRLCNCDIATEGFDAPIVDLVVMGRPTLSRAKYCQMAGRGTRPLPGITDWFTGKDDAHLRRSAIAGSAKPKLTLLDFVGNPSRHSLVSSADVLGGDYSDDEVELAKKKQRESGDGPSADVKAMLDQARLELQQIAKAIKVDRVKTEKRSFDPFACLGIERPKLNKRWGDDEIMASPNQRKLLEKAGLKPDQIIALSRKEASALISEVIDRRNTGLATLAQMKVLSQMGVTKKDVSFKDASEALNYIASTSFGRKAPIDPIKLNALVGVGRMREPGEEG